MKIVFRKFPQGDVIAMFCNTAKECGPDRVMSYMRIGQHGEACRHLGRNLKLASEQEYTPLKREIERIYQCEITPVTRLVA